MEALVPILLFGGIVFIIFYSIARRSRRAKSRAKDIEGRIQELRRKVIVVTTGSLPGKGIRSVLGSVTGISGVAASTDAEFHLAEKEAMLAVMRRALKMGANAVVDLRMATGSYERQGSKWMVSKVAYTGTAVRV